ncbi:MAG: DUF1674 domain-containing protein [Thermomonas sp.]|uniref:DUF1674 domain-containing protein n=1 Tax=Thermomonas sp. TaxID=1971895 RepID=UPI0026159672|nr:DUF1674 domain-containing protein [Thermomonas sp.]MCC7096099.1 DUF1674 domain-containing protein [Thermomonas sp.]
MNASLADRSNAGKELGDSPGAGVGQPPAAIDTPALPPEHGGRKSGLEPTRYGDWEKDGRCIDF